MQSNRGQSLSRDCRKPVAERVATSGYTDIRGKAPLKRVPFMSKINIIVTHIEKGRFSGGILCVLQYAKGLRAKGHDVRIVPMRPSDPPQWFDGDFGEFPRYSKSYGLRVVFSLLKSILAPQNFRKKNRKTMKSAIGGVATELGLMCFKVLPAEIRRGVSLGYVKKLITSYYYDADITLATAYETALPAYLYGTGKCCYFVQHFEPLFSIDFEDAEAVRREALLSYRLGLRIIANSSWLREKLRNEVGVDAQLSPNAIDHEIFNGDVKNFVIADAPLKIISYGGRGAKWKGFADMLRAVKIARDALGVAAVEWYVYGACEMEPNNSTASFEQLGFLAPRALAEAYKRCDVLLSASWYESFPLFPLEAMACGLAVICTQDGTEEFAIHGDTAEIVKAGDPSNIAAAIIKLSRDVAYRRRIAERGKEMSLKFTWENSVAQMERLLLR